MFIRKPNIELLPGVRITKDMYISCENETVKQTIENLVLHSITEVQGEGYISKYDTTIELEEGDVLIFEEDGRGYIKPVEDFVTIEEAIDELTCIQDLGCTNVRN